MHQPFAPTDEQRSAVRAARAEGRGQAEIASALGISLPTLRKYFRGELDGAAVPRDAAGLALFDVASAPHSHAPTPRPEPRPVGRPPYVPTSSDREKVELLVASGTKHGEIALVLSISEPTLREAYAVELKTGPAKRRAEAVLLLYKAAKSNNVSAIKEWNAKLLEAELARLGGDVAAPPASKKEDTLGKKAIQAVDAHEVLTGDGEWAHLLSPVQGSA